MARTAKLRWFHVTCNESHVNDVGEESFTYLVYGKDSLDVRTFVEREQKCTVRLIREATDSEVLDARRVL